MTQAATLDALFVSAVAAIDAGDVGEVERLTREHPRLLRERLDRPGPWLREKVAGALDGFFKRPYLLWFIAEDPVRNDTLPKNIADVARSIIDAAKREQVATLQEQLDYALQLVAWSWVARRCGVQGALIDVLVDAGAAPDGVPDSALVNGHVEAAEGLVQRGAKLTLATALCLGRWDDIPRLAPTTTARDKQMALTLTALNGGAEALVMLIQLGVNVNSVSPHLYSHAAPLHHAVASGSIDAVKVLVEAGANRAAKDSVHGATPLGWAQHYLVEQGTSDNAQRYAAIVEHLSQRS